MYCNSLDLETYCRIRLIVRELIATKTKLSGDSPTATAPLDTSKAFRTRIYLGQKPLYTHIF